MKVTFIGANRVVTGSCTYVECAGTRLIVDYGMQQGKIDFESASLPCSPGEIDYVVLTHAHIDHSGMLPLLYKNGFKGNIHATITTRNLSEIMLADCAHIQESDAEWKTRKNMRAGKPPVEPIYDSEDVAGVLQKFIPHRYDEKFVLAEGIEVRFVDAGHLLGSASVEMWLTEDGVTKKIVFSGDVGNINQPLLRDPQLITEADYVVLESTYGDRLHEAPPDYPVALAGLLQRTFDRGGNVVIPAFAVGRTQEMLYFIRRIKEEGLVHGHDGFPVYVDSPLAISATRVFIDNAEFCYDEEARAMLDAGKDPLAFENLHATATSEESIAINDNPTPKVIISASGMCEAGRIRHHLKHNLWRPECTIVFVGYQAEGTLGRILVDGVDEVSIMGEDIAVQAEIVMLPGASGHGDMNQLIAFAKAFDPKPVMTFINHGENEVSLGFADKLTNEFGIPAMAPASGTEYDLANGCLIRLTDPIPAKKEEPQQSHEEAVQQAKDFVKNRWEKNTEAYEKLQKAFNRLSAVVDAYRDESDQNISGLRNAIYSLLDRFENRVMKRASRSDSRNNRRKKEKKQNRRRR